MKNRFGLYFAMAGSLVLTGCSMESPEENFYRVDFYSDYVGFDEDYESGALDYTKANLIGHAYAKKEKVVVSEAVETATYYGVTEPTKLEGDDASASYKESTREAPEGHSWVFDKWVGFYDDGTAIDLKQIKENCRVFAHYKDQKESYIVNIDGYTSNRMTFRVPYGEKLADQATYQSSPMAGDPTHKYSDRYFETSALTGLQVTSGEDDLSSLVPEQSVTPYVTTIENWEVTKTLTFEFLYGSAVKKHYNVTYDCQDEDGNTIQAASQVSIEYGKELPLPDLAGYSYIRPSGNYSDEAKALDSSLDEIDINHIFYDATVTLIYRRKAVEHKVYVYDDTGLVLQNGDDPLIAYDGKISSMPAPTLSSGKTFTGKWVVLGTGALFDPEATLDVAEISVVPVSVDASYEKNITLVNHAGGSNIAGKVKFSFNRNLQGFVVSSLSDDTSAPLSAEYHISAADLTYSGSATYALAGMSFPTVGIQAFGGSSITQKIYQLEIPTSIKEISGTALRGMANLGSLDLSECAELTSIGDYAFEACSMLSSINLPVNLTELGNHAFSRCTSLSSIYLPSGISEISDYAFDYCTSLSNIMLPGTVTKIGSHAFEHCSALTHISLSVNVREIGASAFENSGLTSISIPNGVTSIGAYSFRNCSDLANITLPASVTSVGSKIAFGSNLLAASGNGIHVNLTESAVNAKITAGTWSSDWLQLDDAETPAYVNVSYAA